MAQIVPEQEVQRLLQSDEGQLLELLGMRAAVVTRDLPRSAEIQPNVAAADVKTMGIKDDMKELGGRILKRWNRAAWELVCGDDPDDAKTRGDFKAALGVGEAAAIGALTAGLISIGLMAALAPVVAAILVKKFFNPAYGEFCGFWKEKL